jgi:uncharacterized protein
MRLETSDNPRRSRFELHVDGELVGFADYRLQSDVLSLPHTEVQSKHRGRGFASTLIRDTLDTARKRGLAVLPQCPYVSQYIAEHPDYLPLVPADQRDRYGLPA